VDHLDDIIARRNTTIRARATSVARIARDF
jgi:hypothetical protein